MKTKSIGWKEAFLTRTGAGSPWYQPPGQYQSFPPDECEKSSATITVWWGRVEC